MSTFYIVPSRKITGSGSSGGITSINGQTGPIIFAATSPLTLDVADNTLTFALGGTSGFVSKTGDIMTGNLQMQPTNPEDYGLRLSVNSGSPPSNGVEGSLIYQHGVGLKYYDGTTWNILSAALAGITEGAADARYLMLNGSNSPITGAVTLSGTVTFGGNLTLPTNPSNHALYGLQLLVSSTDPSAPVQGALYFNSSLGLRYYNGSAWTTVSGFSQTIADARYLQLNASNGPITGSLTFNNNLTVSGTSNLGPIVSTSSASFNSVSAATGTFTNAQVSAAPTTSTDAVNKTYADAIRQGLTIKDACIVATTSSSDVPFSSYSTGVITTSGAVTSIDGISLSSGNRVLIKDYSGGNSKYNGIYTYTNSTTFTRSTDANSSTNVLSGMFIYVSRGTSNAGNSYILTTFAPITLGSSSLTFVIFGGAGGGAGALIASNNLSDLPSPSAARTNLGLDSAATHASTDFILSSARGANSGVAELDSGGLIPVAELPAATTGAAGTMSAADKTKLNGISAGASATLAGDTDVLITSPTNNQVLTYNSGASKWENANPTSGSSTLAADTDVLLTSPTNNQVLTYNSGSSKWINATPTPGSSTLASDTDVLITSPTNGQVLTYNSGASKWENASGGAGTRGSLWYSGSGAPGTIGGQLNNDMYIDYDTDNLYQRISGTWTIISNLKSIQTGTISLAMCVGLASPSSGADTSEFIVPAGEDGTTSLVLTLQSCLVQATSAGSTSTTLIIEQSTSTGVFTEVTASSTITLASSVNSQTTSGLTSFIVNSGDKIRFNITSLGTGVGGLTIIPKFSIGAGPTRLVLIPLMSSLTPTTGPDTFEAVLPAQPITGSSAVYTLREVMWRANGTGSGTSTIKIETSLGDSTFSMDQQTADITIGSTNYEQISTNPGLVCLSGDKIRANVSAVGPQTLWTIWTSWSY